MVEHKNKINRSFASVLNGKTVGDAGSLYDLSIVGVILVAPLVVTELWFATYDSYYIRRDFSVEFGSRFTGDVYTASVSCPGTAQAHTPMFRAWDEADANAFLAKRHKHCRIKDVISGGKVYRKRIWQGS